MKRAQRVLRDSFGNQQTKELLAQLARTPRPMLGPVGDEFVAQAADATSYLDLLHPKQLYHQLLKRHSPFHKGGGGNSPIAGTTKAPSRTQP